MKRGRKKINMLQIMCNPRYKGRHVAVIAGRVFTAKTGAEMNRMLDKLEKRYPKQIPAITYIPKADALILLCP